MYVCNVFVTRGTRSQAPAPLKLSCVMRGDPTGDPTGGGSDGGGGTQ